VTSKFVGDEIVRFKQLKKDDCLLAVIIEGEPNASEAPHQGNEKSECFPLALRYQVDEQGKLTDRRVEPIAADFRLPDGSPGWTGPAAYREALEALKLPSGEIKKRVQSYSEHSRTMLLKIVAGILGVPLRMLTQREQAYQLKKQREKALTLRRWLSVVALLAVVAMGAALYANNRRLVANRATQEEQTRARELRQALTRVSEEQSRTERSLANSRVLLAEATWNGTGSTDYAHAYLDGIPEQHRHWEWGYLKRKYEGCLATYYGHADSVVGASYSADGSRIVSASVNGLVLVMDAETGEVLERFSDHLDEVYCVNCSADGQFIAMGRADGTIRIRDLVTGVEVRRLDSLQEPAQDRGVASLCFSPDGGQLVSGSLDGTIRVWNTITGERLLEFHGQGETIKSVQFSPDGHYIASGAGNRIEDASRPTSQNVVIWDVTTGKALKELSGAAIGITCVGWSPDGKQIAAGVADGTVLMWNAVTGEVVWEKSVEVFSVQSVCFNSDGRTLFSSGSSGILKALDSATGDEVFSCGAISTPSCLIVSSHGDRVGGGCQDGAVRIWNTKEKLQDGVVVRDYTWPFMVSPDGSLIASRSNTHDDVIVVWDAVTGERKLELEGWFGSNVCFSPDGTHIAFGTRDRDDTRSTSYSGIRVWNLKTGDLVREMREIEDEAIIENLSFNSDGSCIIAANNIGSIRIWEVASGRWLSELYERSENVQCVGFNQEGSRVVSASDDEKIRIWNTETEELLLSFEVESHDATSLCFNPESSLIASGEMFGEIRIWDVHSGAELHVLKGHTGSVDSLTFSSDGSRLVSLGSDSSMRFWDPITGQSLITIEEFGAQSGRKCLSFCANGRSIVAAGEGGGLVIRNIAETLLFSTPRAHDVAPIYCMRFSPDGSLVASSSATSFAALWDSATGKRLFRLDGHTSSIPVVAFSPDGQFLASGSSDFSIRVWDCRTGKLQIALDGSGGPVSDVCFSPDGREIASCAEDGVVRLWDLSTGTIDLQIPIHSSHLRFSPDGAQLASVAWDQGVRRISLLHAESGKILSDNAECPQWLIVETSPRAVSPDGKWHWNGESDGTIRRVSMEIPSDELEYRRFMARPDPLWHREQAEIVLQTENWFAARFHLDKLHKLKSDDTEVLQQLNDLQQRFAE
jgi:WD40 repeat protein